MDNLDLDVASDFLLVASTLLEIKAESLLPRERDAVAEEFEELAPSEARDILVERLLAYKQYKNAASALHMRFVSEGRMHPRPFGPDACFLNLMPDYLKDVTMDGLALLAARAFARRDVFLLESEHIAAKPIPVEMCIRDRCDACEQGVLLHCDDGRRRQGAHGAHVRGPARIHRLPARRRRARRRVRGGRVGEGRHRGESRHGRGVRDGPARVSACRERKETQWT